MMRDELTAHGDPGHRQLRHEQLIGPGVRRMHPSAGMHIQEDCFIAEIVDPQTLEPLPNGRRGWASVVTPLFKEAMPILRYRTHDITRLDDTPLRLWAHLYADG